MGMVLRALCAGVALAAIPSAGATQREVVVTPETVTVEQWSGRVSQALERNLAYPRIGFPDRNVEGVVQVSFRCSDDGAPAGATVTRSSGELMLDTAALRAVKRIKGLHPLATGIGHDQRYAAVVIFARDERSRDRKLAALGDEMRVAGAGAHGRSVALVGLAPPVG